MGKLLKFIKVFEKKQLLVFKVFLLKMSRNVVGWLINGECTSLLKLPA